MDGLAGSLDAAVGVAVSNCALSEHDFSWDVRATFVFDVDDARFLVALQYHFARYHVGNVNPSQPAGMVIGVPSSPMNMLSVANFDTPPGLAS